MIQELVAAPPAAPLADPALTREIWYLRLDRLGDVILSTPFIRVLKDAYPQARLTAVVRPYTAPVLEGNTAVDRLLTYDPDQDPSSKRAVADALAEGPVDLAVAHSPTQLTYQLAGRTGAKVRAGYVYPSRLLQQLSVRFQLTHRLPMDLEGRLRRGQRVPHEVEQSMALARFMGLPVPEEPPRLELPLTDETQLWAKERLQAWGWFAHRYVFGMHLSRHWLEGGWGIEGLLFFMRELLDKFVQGNLFVTYGSADAALAQEVEQRLQADRETPPPIAERRGVHPGQLPIGGLTFARRTILAGNMSVKQWASLIRRAKLFISPDTGAAHVAAAMRVPTICVYRPDQFALCSQQWHPWGVDHLDFPQQSPKELAALVHRGIGRLGYPSGF